MNININIYLVVRGLLMRCNYYDFHLQSLLGFLDISYWSFMSTRAAGRDSAATRGKDVGDTGSAKRKSSDEKLGVHFGCLSSCETDGVVDRDLRYS
jgi:hypothetical protein